MSEMVKTMISGAAASVATALVLLLVGVKAHADDFNDAVAEAQSAYQSGRVVAAQIALQRAQERLAAEAAILHTSALPAPLPGWQAQDTPNVSSAWNGVHATTQAARIYTDQTGGRVAVLIVTGTPMLRERDTVLADAVGNPRRGEWVSIGRQMAWWSRGSLRISVGPRVVVVVSGERWGDNRAYAEAIDFTRLIAE